MKNLQGRDERMGMIVVVVVVVMVALWERKKAEKESL